MHENLLAALLVFNPNLIEAGATFGAILI